MKNLTFALALSLAFSLSGCTTDSNGGTGPGTVDSTASRLATQLLGNWKADSTFQLKLGAFNVPTGVSMQVAFAPRGSFTSFVDASLMNNPVQGHLFLETGTWAARSADTVVVHPVSCSAADTIADPAYGGLALPFHSVDGGFAANALKPTACPDSMLITTHPVHDTLRLAMPVTVPTQGKSVWVLAFRKQP